MYILKIVVGWVLIDLVPPVQFLYFVSKSINMSPISSIVSCFLTNNFDV